MYFIKEVSIIDLILHRGGGTEAQSGDVTFPRPPSKTMARAGNRIQFEPIKAHIFNSKSNGPVEQHTKGEQSWSENFFPLTLKSFTEIYQCQQIFSQEDSSGSGWNYRSKQERKTHSRIAWCIGLSPGIWETQELEFRCPTSKLSTLTTRPLAGRARVHSHFWQNISKGLSFGVHQHENKCQNFIILHKMELLFPSITGCFNIKIGGFSKISALLQTGINIEKAHGLCYAASQSIWSQTLSLLAIYSMNPGLHGFVNIRLVFHFLAGGTIWRPEFILLWLQKTLLGRGGESSWKK